VASKQNWSPVTEAADEFEVGSVFNAGSKKQNLNHLLNFQYEPRGTKREQKRQKHQQGRQKHYVPRQKFNKERYLQAK
jgi:hypothetical protein